MERSRQGRRAGQDRFVPGHGVDVEDPQVPQPAAAHAPEDDELGVGPVPVRGGHGRVRLPRRRAGPVTARNIPLHHVGVGAELQSIQIVQISVEEKDSIFLSYLIVHVLNVESKYKIRIKLGEIIALNCY